jgi:hypothetical protein
MALHPPEWIDDESIGDTIRSMKRQIQRAYPLAFEKLRAEKIVVTPVSHGPLSFRLKEPGVFSELQNLFIACPRASTFSGLFGAVERGLSASEWAVQDRPLSVAGSEPSCYSPSI